ncbi:MAG: hypothetical protein CL831_00500 [Crocinitomicaceae bacterium]|nr:hypothetical protein [Crocinitomicaceae bacterium]
MHDRILWLHFGIQKTGSSSFQFLLQKQRQLLLDAGIVYLDPYFSLTPNPWYAESVTSRAFFEAKTFGKIWDDRSHVFGFRDYLLGSIPSSSKHLILSNENFYPIISPQGQPRFDFNALERFAGDLGADIRIVLYLRRQDEHLISYYQERVKASFRLNNASRDFLALPAEIDAYASIVTRTNYYDFVAQISMLQQRFAVEIKLMEDEISEFGLMASHCSAFQLPAACAQLDASKNVGLEAHATVALRRYLAYGHEHGMSQQKMLKAKNYLFRHHAGGRKLDIQLSTKDQIMALHDSANQHLLKMCGKQESALLAPARQSGLTVFEIDTERVDELFHQLRNLTV